MASARTFVARRREAQAALGVFRADDAPGLLLLGMGNLGKSSLAARIANRRSDLRCVVIYEHYHPLKVLDQVVAALPPGERKPVLDTWRDAVAADPAALAEALWALLNGLFYDRPILLIVDDLEQVLEAPAPGQALTPVRRRTAGGRRSSRS